MSNKNDFASPAQYKTKTSLPMLYFPYGTEQKYIYIIFVISVSLTSLSKMHVKLNSSLFKYLGYLTTKWNPFDFIFMEV